MVRDLPKKREIYFSFALGDGSGILRRRYSGQHGLAEGQERPVN
jgi:hypothetical protein